MNEIIHRGASAISGVGVEGGVVTGGLNRGRFRHSVAHPARAFDGDIDDEGNDPRDAPVRALTPAEAKRVRDANPSVSPWRVVGVQAAAGAVCAAVAWLLTQHQSAAWSALYGAAATVLPSALLARGMTRGTRNAVAAAAGFMFWEMLKIGVAIAMLVIAAKVVPHLSWPALLATMVVCIKVNWFALLWRGRTNVKNPGREQHGN